MITRYHWTVTTKDYEPVDPNPSSEQQLTAAGSHETANTDNETKTDSPADGFKLTQCPAYETTTLMSSSSQEGQESASPQATRNGDLEGDSELVKKNPVIVETDEEDEYI